MSNVWEVFTEFYSKYFQIPSLYFQKGCSDFLFCDPKYYYILNSQIIWIVISIVFNVYFEFCYVIILLQ